MIQFVYAMTSGESPGETSSTEDCFAALESAGVGKTFTGHTLYTLIKPQAPGTGANDAGKMLLARAETDRVGELLLENGGAFATPRELWLVLESAHNPRIKIAWNAATARQSGRTAAMAVPTLNLRIGLVRLDQLNDEALHYTKRLAGIGFSGWIVIDPPATGGAEDAERREQARTIAMALKAAIAPRKPVKAAAKAKA